MNYMACIFPTRASNKITQGTPPSNNQQLDVCYTKGIGCNVISVRDTCPFPYVPFPWEDAETQRRSVGRSAASDNLPHHLYSKVTVVFPTLQDLYAETPLLLKGRELKLDLGLAFYTG